LLPRPPPGCYHYSPALPGWVWRLKTWQQRRGRQASCAHADRALVLAACRKQPQRPRRRSPLPTPPIPQLRCRHALHSHPHPHPRPRPSSPARRAAAALFPTRVGALQLAAAPPAAAAAGCALHCWRCRCQSRRRGDAAVALLGRCRPVDRTSSSSKQQPCSNQSKETPKYSGLDPSRIVKPLAKP